MASAYLPYEDSSPPPLEVRRLTEACHRQGDELLVGCDANAHNLSWGSKDTNSRGEHLLEFLLSNNLEILNRGDEPTFRNSRREEVIDITFGSMMMGSYVKQWHVVLEPSSSDHMYIKFKVEMGTRQTMAYRNPRKTDWETYRRDLDFSLSEIKTSIRNPAEFEEVAEAVTSAIVTSYQDNCSITKKCTNRSVPWWNNNLEMQRKQVRRLFNLARRKGQWANGQRYREALVNYNLAIRRAKEASWKVFCEEVEGTAAQARLHKILTRVPTNPGGTLRKEDGEYTKTAHETLELLLKTHFPQYTLGDNSDQNAIPERQRFSGIRKEDWDLAKECVYLSKVRWAVGTFQPFKSPGPDGIFPALLQQAGENLIRFLCRLFRVSLAAGIIPNAWRAVKVVFIPKPGRIDHTKAKDMRPISLSSFILKTLEKLVNVHVGERRLSRAPLHSNQHAYQPGKSCETALHQLVGKVEKALHFQEIALYLPGHRGGF